MSDANYLYFVHFDAWLDDGSPTSGRMVIQGDAPIDCIESVMEVESAICAAGGVVKAMLKNFQLLRVDIGKDADAILEQGTETGGDGRDSVRPGPYGGPGGPLDHPIQGSSGNGAALGTDSTGDGGTRRATGGGASLT